jgi:hypothetical protein
MSSKWVTLLFFTLTSSLLWGLEREFLPIPELAQKESDSSQTLFQLPSRVDVVIDYLDEEGRLGAISYCWQATAKGFVAFLQPTLKKGEWLPFLYEKENHRRTLTKGYERWLAPHHLSEIIGQTPVNFTDLELIDRWIRNETFRGKWKPWERVVRGESWWIARQLETTAKSSCGSASAKRAAAHSPVAR